MKALIYPALAIALLPVAPALAQPSAPQARTIYARDWGPLHQGRWIYGWRAPGGWGGYRPATRGWVLPAYWMAPRYYIGDYARYGWSAPPAGYGWSRYYDDAVLTDPNGVVYETRRNVAWDDYDDYRESRLDYAEPADGPPPLNVKGEVVGATERRGERFLGERRRRVEGPDRGYDGRWSGTWRGSHDGGPETVYQGSFDGEYRGTVPHWRHRGDRRLGYDYGEVETRTTWQPVTTTTITETEEWVPAGSE